MPHVCGRLGLGRSARADAMAGIVGDVTAVAVRPDAQVFAGDGDLRTAGGLLAWSASPLPAGLPPDLVRIANEHDATVLDPAQPALHSGISGTQPVYVDTAGGTIHFATRVDPLARTGDARPDWDAWAHIIAMGAPLGGRTPFAGIRRLPPWTMLRPGEPVPAMQGDTWPWLSVQADAAASADDVREALTARIAELAGSGPLAPLLTGGWDSRVLATLAVEVARTGSAGELHRAGLSVAAPGSPDSPGPDSVASGAPGRVSRSLTAATGLGGEDAPVAWTTSSDHGHALEELIARRVADRLGIEHRIVAARWDEFGTDLAEYGGTVDFCASFHSWEVALARALAPQRRTVLDGLGGGLFVGGDFPDTGARASVIDDRFARLAHYLGDADRVLDARAAAQIRERTGAGFAEIARPLADHPFAASFTAYLTRTVPGISHSPFGVIGAGSPVATPFLADRVVRAALAVAPGRHTGGRLYPEIIRPVAPDVAALTTAAELAPNHRRHQRRISSAVGATVIRDLVLREPVRPLVSPKLAAAGLGEWQELLNRTRAQHLLRGLAMLSLWHERYGPLLGGAAPDELREAPG